MESIAVDLAGKPEQSLSRFPVYSPLNFPLNGRKGSLRFEEYDISTIRERIIGVSL